MLPAIVIDTNVLVAALKSSRGASYRLLSLVDSGRFVLNLSTPLVAEYEEVLKREVPALAVDDIIDYLCAIAHRHKVFYLWRPTLKDPDDDMVLELAVKSGAMIVTWNVRDFAKAGRFGVAVVTPRQFLQQIGELP